MFSAYFLFVLMTEQFKFKLDASFDPSLLERIEHVFHGENLIQMILHAHLLIERAITLRLLDKLKRPEILDDGNYGRWSFHQKITLYVGFYDPPEEQENMLFAFNRLRNMIVHGFEDESACVAKCLPWRGSQFTKPEAKGHVWVIVALLLLELGAIEFIERVDKEH